MVEYRRNRKKGGLWMTNLDCNFRITLEACRVNVKLKQQELADKLGVSRATVWNWENGKTSPTSVQLQKISKITGVPMDYIFLPNVLQ